MGYYQGINDNSDQVMDIRGTSLAPGETGNSVVMYGGNDIVYGSSYNDIIQGGYGNDLLYGYDGNDFLAGQAGNDTLYGGNGGDSLYGGTGNDFLNGQAGTDGLYGGAGNDTYRHDYNSGIDYINDNQTETGQQGYGGGVSDTLEMNSLSIYDLLLYRDNNDLIVTSTYDIADGFINDAVVIQNHYLGGDYRIELIATYDGSATMPA